MKAGPFFLLLLTHLPRFTRVEIAQIMVCYFFFCSVRPFCRPNSPIFVLSSVIIITSNSTQLPSSSTQLTQYQNELSIELKTDVVDEHPISKDVSSEGKTGPG
jgi:hypothetical protein